MAFALQRFDIIRAKMEKRTKVPEYLSRHSVSPDGMHLGLFADAP